MLSMQNVCHIFTNLPAILSKFRLVIRAKVCLCDRLMFAIFSTAKYRSGLYITCNQYAWSTALIPIQADLFYSTMVLPNFCHVKRTFAAKTCVQASSQSWCGGSFNTVDGVWLAGDNSCLPNSMLDVVYCRKSFKLSDFVEFWAWTFDKCKLHDHGFIYQFKLWPFLFWYIFCCCWFVFPWRRLTAKEIAIESQGI